MHHAWCIFIFCMLVCVCTALPRNDAKELFDNYVIAYSKTYQKGNEEYDIRYNNFLATLKRIELRNEVNFMDVPTADKETNAAYYGINMFSDLSQAEFKEKYLSFVPMNSSQVAISEESSGQIPKKFDWRKQNVVTPVKNQGQCGSCWAFSTVENIESMWAISGHKLVALSTQQIIDCSAGSHGCQGGIPCATLAWMKKNKIKLVPDSIYPYHDKKGKCINESSSVFGAGVSGYFCTSCNGLCPNVEMQQMLPKVYNNGPLTVSVDALSWQDYMGGIIQHHCSYDNANHAVQIVGFDMTGDVPYWIVRNSWGSRFGMDGYLYIKIGGNICGVANSYSGVTSVFSL